MEQYARSLIASVHILNTPTYPIFNQKFGKISCKVSEVFCREFDSYPNIWTKF